MTSTMTDGGGVGEEPALADNVLNDETVPRVDNDDVTMTFP